MPTSPDPKSTDDSLDPQAGPIASRYVRSLLSRHSIPSMRHVTTISKLINVGYQPAYRRMTGQVAWELEEIERLAAHFGETLADVFSPEKSEAFVAATLVVPPVRMSCQIIPGSPVRDASSKTLVAVKSGEHWLVVPSGEAGLAGSFAIQQLRITGQGDRRWRLAVLDDDAEETSTLAQHFVDRGCEVQAFTSVDDLVPEMKLRPFDGYVIDWMLAEGSAAELVGMIRADDRDCPIAVLTGKIRSDVLVEPAVAEAIETYQLLFFEKPTRLPIISAQMLKSLAAR